MLQLVTERPGQLTLKTVARPAIERPGDVMLRVSAAGICGSDVHIYHGTSPVATYPRVMGHEIVGVVEQVGTAVTSVQVGDSVIVNQIISCGRCHPCKVGRPNVCCQLAVRGVHVDGGYREYMVVDQQDLFVLPPNLSNIDAVMIEPLSIAFQARSRADITADDIVFILGAGALGKSLIKAIQMTGAELIVADVVAERLQEAAALGVKHVVNASGEQLLAAVRRLTDGCGPTVAIDAAGFPASLELLTELTCNAGRIITMAFLTEPSAVAQFKITAKELDIRGSRLQNNKFREVIAAIEQGLLDISGLVSHTMPFTEAQAAFDLIESKDPAIKKIVLTFD